MSPDMERLVGRAILDKEFREKLMADPEGAIKDAEFKLSQDELEGVVKEAKSRGADPAINRDLDAARNGGW